MAATKQQTYRRLMKEHKTKAGAQRIKSLLAKYNSVGQLSCAVCETVVKSEALWPSHVQGKRHKETIAALKTRTATPTNSSPAAAGSTGVSKGPPSNTFLKPTQPPQGLKRKLSQRNEDSETRAALTGSTVERLKQIVDKEAEESVMETGDGKSPVKEERTPVLSNPALPADFFDDPDTSLSPSIGQQSIPEPSDSTTQDKQLPAGFFDDPKLDAKMRKVEFIDPKESEWEEFQKTIRKETEVSEALLQVDDEVAMVDRELVEVNEQVAFYQKAEALRVRQEEWVAQQQRMKAALQQDQGESAAMETQSSIGEDDSDDDVDIDQLLDWRSKFT